MRRHSLMMKLLILYVVSATIPALLIGITSISKTQNVLWDNIVYSTEQYVEQITRSIDSTFEEVKYFQSIGEESCVYSFLNTEGEDYATDNLSLMRGMDVLALDCYEDPDVITEAMDYMDYWWIKLHEKLYQLTKTTNDGGGVLPWMSLWAPGRIDQLANDFSSILSPSMFKDLFVHDITTMGAWTEYGMYHLDGPACIRNHLDTLLEIDCIKAIEFTPGAGSPPTFNADYIPRYRKILESGKRLYLLAKPEEVQPLCEALPSKGLFLCTWANSREAADRILDDMYKWSKK